MHLLSKQSKPKLPMSLRNSDNRKNYFCILNIERPRAHLSSITFFLYTLYILVFKLAPLLKVWTDSSFGFSILFS